LGQLLHRDVNQVGYNIGMIDGRCDVTATSVTCLRLSP